MRPYKALQGYFVDPLGTILGRFWGYLAQFDPILSHFGIILGSFLGHLEQFWNHLGLIFKIRPQMLNKRSVRPTFFLAVWRTPLAKRLFSSWYKKGLLNFWCLKVPLLTPILAPHFGSRFAQEAAKMNTEAHQELQRPKNSLFKTLKKPAVFQHFWVQRPPKRTARSPRRLPRGTQRAPKPKEKLKINERQNWSAGRKCLSPAISI